MRTAIFHDYFSNIGGGEQVIKELAKLFQADVYTTDISVPDWFTQDISLFSIGNTLPAPCLKQTNAIIRFFTERINEHYDLYICSGNWAHYAAFHHTPVIMYCQDAPVRALYDQYSHYLHNTNPILRPIFAGCSALLRIGDQEAIKKIHTIVANSRAVQNRVRKYYSRIAPVIYPPIDTSKYTWKPSEGFWLSVNRIYPEKQVDLQIEIFSKMPEQKLYVVGGIGSGDHARKYANTIKRRASHFQNIEILGTVTEEVLLSLYSRCTGLICTATDEAFGITPIEAMASGKPVIALKSGGYLETVIPTCGILVERNIDVIINTIREVSMKSNNYQIPCRNHASQFDLVHFHDQFRALASEVIRNNDDKCHNPKL